MVPCEELISEALKTAQTIAKCSYGHDFTAIVGEKNFMGCQFHPERSGSVGARILQNFLEMQ